MRPPVIDGIEELDSTGRRCPWSSRLPRVGFIVTNMTTDPDLVITGPTIATLPQPSAAEMLSGGWGIPA